MSRIGGCLLLTLVILLSLERKSSPVNVMYTKANDRKSEDLHLKERRMSDNELVTSTTRKFFGKQDHQYAFFFLNISLTFG